MYGCPSDTPGLSVSLLLISVFDLSVCQLKTCTCTYVCLSDTPYLSVSCMRILVLNLSVRTGYV